LQLAGAAPWACTLPAPRAATQRLQERRRCDGLGASLLCARAAAALRELRDARHAGRCELFVLRRQCGER
jgi:hypothetical protein